MIRPLRKTQVFETKSGPEEISLHAVLWAEGCTEGSQRFSLLHLADRTVECRIPFETLRPLLGDAFLFCLSCGAVNGLRIRSFEAERIVLDNGETLTISPFLAPKEREKLCRELARRVWED